MAPARIEAILGAIPMPLLLIGPDLRIAALNAGAEALFGSNARDRNHVTVLRHPAMLDCIEEVLATGTTQVADYRHRSTGRDTAYRVSASPLEGGVLLTFEDTGAAEVAREMRRDFVANVSHELRSPLTAMLGFIETLRGPARGDANVQDRFLCIMQAEAARMNRLIQDLLSLSQVEANERLRPAGRVDLASVTHQAVATLAGQASEAGVSLVTEGIDVPATVPGDADQLLQVLTNLIENAIKYGGKTVTVRLCDIPRDPDLRVPGIRVEVVDNGAGIDPLLIPRLTERFFRADAHRSREKGGTGLGLAIVKHIVGRHRGHLRIDSKPGQGSRFAATLPRQ